MVRYSSKSQKDDPICFKLAAVVLPEMQSSKSRAMYGVDVMLDYQFQPKLLEVCDRTFSFYAYSLASPVAI